VPASAAASSDNVRVTPSAVPLRVPKTAELVADRLRKQIVRGELREGESLPAEAALTEQFGVSRPTLREAFRVLETEQLITVRRGARGGASVHAPRAMMVARYAGFFLEHDGASLADVLEARVAVESPAAGLAAQRRTAGDLASLRSAIAECEQVDADRRRLVLQFSEFHALVVATARNRTIALLHAVLREIIDMAKLRRLGDDPDGPSLALARGTEAHRHLVELIAAGDAPGAEAWWQRHLREANRYLLAIPGGDEPLDLLD
jgi:GntR family transcriptional regulator, transcriptional repressor for pyruvate dehydrogenase complex